MFSDAPITKGRLLILASTSILVLKAIKRRSADTTPGRACYVVNTLGPRLLCKIVYGHLLVVALPERGPGLKPVLINTIHWIQSSGFLLVKKVADWYFNMFSKASRHWNLSLRTISLLRVTVDLIWYTELNWLKRDSTVGIVQTKTLLLYLLIRGKLLHSDQHLWNEQVPLCPLYPLLKMHRS